MNTIIRRTLLTLILIALGGGVILNISDGGISKKTEANPISEEQIKEMQKEYSEDQKKFIESFGRPDSWDIVFNKDEEPIIETWKYMELGEAVTFADSKFVDRVEFEVEVPEDSVLVISKIEPKDVYGINSIFELNGVLKAKPTAIADLDEANWAGARTYYEYDDIVNAGTSEGDLVYVKTKSFYVPISELDLDTSKDHRNEIASNF